MVLNCSKFNSKPYKYYLFTKDSLFKKANGSQPFTQLGSQPLYFIKINNLLHCNKQDSQFLTNLVRLSFYQTQFFSAGEALGFFFTAFTKYVT